MYGIFISHFTYKIFINRHFVFFNQPLQNVVQPLSSITSSKATHRVAESSGSEHLEFKMLKSYNLTHIQNVSVVTVHLALYIFTSSRTITPNRDLTVP